MYACIRSKIPRSFWLLTVFILTVSLFAQSIIVCPECSHEAVPDAHFCAHCGARIEKTETAPDIAPSQSDATAAYSEHEGVESQNSSETLTPDYVACVKENIDLATRFMTAANNPNPAAALVTLINARAIIAISPPGTIDPDTRSTVLKGIISMREAVSRMRTTCPQCHGKGQDDVIQNISSLDDTHTPHIIRKRTCPMCAGRGKILRLRKIPEIKNLIGMGKQMLMNEAIVNERMRVGNAWISPDLAARLTVRQQGLLRHYTADPCPNCAGFGKTDCSTCDNTGLAPCPEKDCSNGYIRPPAPPRFRTQQQRIESMRIVAPRICPVCKGTARITCTQCAGTGSIACQRCNSSGKRNVCSKCKGENVQPCKTCRGSGKDRRGKDCTMCSGEGVILCTSCGGDGYGR